MTMHVCPRLGRGLAAIGLLAPLALGACNNDPESGGLTINYSFAPGVSCDQHQENVQDIRVEVGPNVDPNVDPEADETAPCDNAGGEIVLAGVPAGSYDLRVLGIDGDLDAVLDNLGGETSDDRVEIIGGDSKTIDAVLGLAPARLEVALVVTNDDFPAQCSSSEIMIKGLRAQAWDFNSSDQLESHEFDLCEFDGFEAVPDLMRNINGRRFDGVVLQPLDGTGSSVGASLEIPFSGPVGAGKLAQVSVECEGETCTAELLAGDPGTTTSTPDPTGEDPTGSDPTSDDGTTGGGGGTAGGDTTGG